MAVSGCAPGTPDDDSWRDDAQRALSDASSAVQSAELGLREGSDDRIFDRYLQTVLVDAEGAVGTASDTISAKQPPLSERHSYDEVTTQLDDAASLVTTARIAVVDRRTDRYDALADQLGDTADTLQSLELGLETPPP
jgi:hypothetical protein